MENDSDGKESYQGYFFMSEDTFSCLKNKQKKRVYGNGREVLP